MKFKVGDKVRVNREWLIKQAEESFIKYYEVSWWEIKKIVWNDIYCPNNEYRYEEKYLELVPEETEFKYWEVVEVYSLLDRKRVERIFVCEAYWALYPYICVSDYDKENFKNGGKYNTVSREIIRKLPLKLSRKEIAEKLWVSEDFVLVD